MRSITIPMLKSTISVVVVLIINGTLKVFEVVLQLTNGGPNHYSETMVTYSYNTTFRDSDFGYGMSMAVIVFLICSIFSALYLRMTWTKNAAA
jgi:multiple sugar transport system permease protein/raffinose/stachyose/melibiose transport system permease protein